MHCICLHVAGILKKFSKHLLYSRVIDGSVLKHEISRGSKLDFNEIGLRYRLNQNLN